MRREAQHDFRALDRPRGHEERFTLHAWPVRTAPASALRPTHRRSLPGRTLTPYDGASVYVRGQASRQGIASALLRLAERHAREHGAKSIQIQASLAGAEFYRANGFEAIGVGEAVLMSGRSMPCVQMRKELHETDCGA